MSNNIYCVDSSALIDLHKYYGQQLLPSLWKELDSLFSNNDIFSHKLVLDELTTEAKKPSTLSKWVLTKKVYFKSMTDLQATYVSSIIKLFPKIIDPYCEKDQADPWLIALVLEERLNQTFFTAGKNIVIVSQENINSDNKIPAVCKHYHITHFNLLDFFKANGWEFKFEKH